MKTISNFELQHYDLYFLINIHTDIIKQFIAQITLLCNIIQNNNTSATRSEARLGEVLSPRTRALARIEKNPNIFSLASKEIYWNFCYQKNHLLLFDKNKNNFIKYKIKIRNLSKTQDYYIIFNKIDKSCNNFQIYSHLNNIFKNSIRNTFILSKHKL